MWTILINIIITQHTAIQFSTYYNNNITVDWRKQSSINVKIIMELFLCKCIFVFSSYQISISIVYLIIKEIKNKALNFVLLRNNFILNKLYNNIDHVKIAI